MFNITVILSLSISCCTQASQYAHSLAYNPDMVKIEDNAGRKKVLLQNRVLIVNTEASWQAEKSK
jgi:hypothetical protein